ncbi:MAG: DUF2092 domain-containing protein [Candidatus Polarisedimenticolia bacterium]
MKRTGGRLPVLLVLLCAAGCAARAPVTSPPEPQRPAGLRALTKGRIELGDGSHRFEAALALRRPDRLRVEVSGAVGGTRAVLALNGEDVIVLLPAERSYVTGPATSDMLESLIGLPLDGAGLVRLLEAVDDAVDAGAAGVPGLALTREDGRLVATPEPGSQGRFQRLELRVRELQRLDPAALPDSVFTPSVPAGWRRLDPAGAPHEGPLLLP